MKTGIFISGLGQSFVHESVEKYGQRLVNEMNYAKTGVTYRKEVSKVTYTEDKQSTLVEIHSEGAQGSELVYRLYEFDYNKLLTDTVNKRNLLIKNLMLLWSVASKTRLIYTRLFSRNNYNRPWQTFYLFLIYALMTTAVILLVPSTIGILTQFGEQVKMSNVWENLGMGKDFNVPYISKAFFDDVSKFVMGLTALLVTFLPNANVLIIDLATEFLCANDYLEYGASRKLIQGHLDQLIETIVEADPDCEIHLHTYSFGSLIALDHLYPQTDTNTANTTQHIKALITIGCPYEFVNAYYPIFYRDRNFKDKTPVKWLNVHSLSDALSSSFRHDLKSGTAQYGLDGRDFIPENVDYEIYPYVKFSLKRFYTLFYIRVHGQYWDAHTTGQSCLRQVFNYMKRENFV